MDATGWPGFLTQNQNLTIALKSEEAAVPVAEVGVAKLEKV